MNFLLYLVSGIVNFLLGALQLFMLVRAIMSWLPFDDDNPLYNFVFAVTEPIIIPVRVLLERFDFMRGFPIDMSFFITYLLISILQILLA